MRFWVFCKMSAYQGLGSDNRSITKFDETLFVDVIDFCGKNNDITDLRKDLYVCIVISR